MSYIDVIPVTIVSGQSLSPQVNLGNKTLVGIQMPSGWTSAALTFQASPDGGSTFCELFTYQSATGAAVEVQVDASQFVAVDPTQWKGVNCIKVRSGTSGSAVTQTRTGGTTINLIVRPLA